MSAAASTTISPVTVPDGALSALLAAVGAVDLATAPAPAKENRCRHYQAVGPANDFIRRLTAYRNQRIDEFNVLARKHQDELTAKAELLQPESPDEAAMAELDALKASFENELMVLQQPIDILGNVMRAEIVHQYPELTTGRAILVDEDWNVGWYPGHEDGTIEKEVAGSVSRLLAGLIFGGLGSRQRR